MRRVYSLLISARLFVAALIIVAATSFSSDADASPYDFPGILISYALSNAGLTPAHPQGLLLRPSFTAWTRPDVQTFVSRFMRQSGYTPTAMVLAASFLSGSDMPDGTCIERLSYEPVLPPSGYLLNLMFNLYVYPR